MKQQHDNANHVRKVFFGKVFFLIILLSGTLISTEVFSQVTQLKPTPRDVEGPFYPLIRQTDEDSNLLQVAGLEKTATGDILYLSGRVIDLQGKPYGNAIVEIWQTDKNGLYKDTRDRSTGKRDPYFQYWGKAKCNDDGSYAFTTLVPGEYSPRPAHIHFKVWINDVVRLTSQIYFKQQDPHEGLITSKYATPDLLTVELLKIDDGKYKAWFQIVL